MDRDTREEAEEKKTYAPPPNNEWVIQVEVDKNEKYKGE